MFHFQNSFCILVTFFSLNKDNTWVNGFLTSDKQKLSEIQTLVFKKNEYTTGKRVLAVLQLQCTGGSYGCYSQTPDKVYCANSGTDGRNVIWECKADLPNNVKFGTTIVGCEGYSTDNDPFILKDSCGLKYSLERTDSIINKPPLIIDAITNNTSSGSGNRIRTNDIQTLTLKKGALTTGRRLSPIPQLKCLGTPSSCFKEPNTVVCQNRGTDGQSTQWECITSDLPKRTKFEKINVVCEGYENSQDTYVLAGSCGLEYTLTDDFREKHPEIAAFIEKHPVITLCGSIVGVILFVVFMWLKKRFCGGFGGYSSSSRYHRTSGGYSGGGGGGGGTSSGFGGTSTR